MYAAWAAASGLERAATALQAVGLDERMDHRPDELSGGQQQRVAIARALATQAEHHPGRRADRRAGYAVWRGILNIFRALNEQGITVIVVTHDPDVAQRTQRIIWIRDGLIQHKALTSGLGGWLRKDRPKLFCAVAQPGACRLRPCMASATRSTS
jgi:putative ABC transport system ATP-binding protein